MKLQWTTDYFRIIPIHLIPEQWWLQTEEEGRVQLTVYTLTGEKIKELREESLSAGYYESYFTGEGVIEWNLSV
ncbi:MAG: hypothetical protein IPG53_22735 [Ignavibacteriales bacterium]|nr:hypothetical protein [Ignavibacteriales bacterium]